MAPDLIVQWIFTFHNAYPFVGTLMILMLLDFGTGICAAFITKKLSSATSYVGMVRKVVMLLAVGLGAVLEPYANGIPLSKMIALCFTVTELISIIENMNRAGVPIPQPLVVVLESMKKQAPESVPIASQVTIGHATTVDIHSETPKAATSSDSVITRTVETTQTTNSNAAS